MTNKGMPVFFLLGILTVYDVQPHFAELAPSGGLLLEGTHVVDLRSGTVIRNHDVLISHGKIQAVTASGSTDMSADVIRIKLPGHFVMPGLIDAHVHLDHASAVEVFPAYGVTTVINMRGDLSHVRLREKTKSGDFWGASFYTAGDYIEGWPQDFSYTKGYQGLDDILSEILIHKNSGFDFVKLYETLSQDQFKALMREARKHDMPVIGHIPAAIPLSIMVDEEIAAIAHLEELVRVVQSQEIPGITNVDLVREAVSQLVKAKTTPCIVTNYDYLANRILEQNKNLDQYLSDPAFDYVHPAIFQFFRPGFNRFEDRDQSWRDRTLSDRSTLKRLISELDANDICLLAGTDAYAPGVPAGSSLPSEIYALKEAGMTAIAALRSATTAPADFISKHIDRSARLGEVKAGYEADLVVLNGNPLEDLDELGDIVGVVLDGTWRPKEILIGELDRLSESFKLIDIQVRTFESKIESNELQAAAEIAKLSSESVPLFHLYILPFLMDSALSKLEADALSALERRAVLDIMGAYARTYPYSHTAQRFHAEVAILVNEPSIALVAINRALEIHPHDPDSLALREQLATQPIK